MEGGNGDVRGQAQEEHWASKRAIRDVVTAASDRGRRDRLKPCMSSDVIRGPWT
jgi:hypothetical protein